MVWTDILCGISSCILGVLNGELIPLCIAEFYYSLYRMVLLLHRFDLKSVPPTSGASDRFHLLGIVAFNLFSS